MPPLAAEITVQLGKLKGSNTARIRAFRHGISERIADCPPREVIRLALELLHDPTIVSRFVAYELIAHHRGATQLLRERELRRLGKGIDSWGAVDMFSMYLAGPAWRERRLSDRIVKEWARSSNRWWRRAALVSTVPLNVASRGGRGDPGRTLSICRMLASDRDDMVIKAMSWALRALAKRDPEAVQGFVAKHSEELAKRVIREVRNKMTTGLKNPK